MDFKFFVIGFTALCLATIVLSSTSNLMAEDVYNFYFQKAPGPVTVNQSGVSHSPQLPDSQAPTHIQSQGQVSKISQSAAPIDSSAQPEDTVKTKTVSQPPLEPGFKHWQIFFGQSSSKSFPTSFDTYGDYPYLAGVYPAVASVQWNLGLGYKFSRYFGLTAELMQVQGEPLKFDGNTFFDYAAGAVVTPFHISFSGSYFINIGLIGGLISVPVFLQGYFDAPGDLISRYNTYYLGGELELALGRSFSILGEMKYLPAIRTTQTTALLALNL